MWRGGTQSRSECPHFPDLESDQVRTPNRCSWGFLGQCPKPCFELPFIRAAVALEGPGSAGLGGTRPGAARGKLQLREGPQRRPWMLDPGR